MTTQVKISEIDRDPALKVRNHLDKGAVQRYIDCDTLWPPVDLFKIDGALKLAAGWHRLAAAEQRGDTAIPATIHRGTMKDAEAFALTDNAKHGLPLSVEERDEAIIRLHELKWSNRKIATELSITDMTVGRALKAAEVQQLLHHKEIQGVSSASLRAIAAAPRNQWEALGTATAKHKWREDETKQAVGNICDPNLTEKQKAHVLKTGAPIAHTDKGEPALLKGTVDRVMGETTEMNAAMKLGKIEAEIRTLCDHWPAEKIVDGIIKFGQKDFDALLEELPEEIAMLQAILDEAKHRRSKLKLVAS